jgi:glycosyltransferase involved in cell wall biosynthesis
MTIKKAVAYSFSLGAQEPMAYLRLYAPLREAGIELVDGFNDRELNFDAINNADIVILQREFPVRYEDYQEIIKRSRQANKPVVYELDDLLFLLPESHPDRQLTYFAPSVLPMMQAISEADLVTVTTEKLAEVVRTINPRVEILPNYFDDRIWKLTPPTPVDNLESKIVIGFMGTNSHKPDLVFLAPVLKELAKDYPEKLEFHFWGAEPPETLSKLSQVHWTSEYFSAYEEFAAFFQTQKADIFIAPLVDNLFNRCKSPLKFLEYSALGAACVCSDLEPYNTIVKHRHTGLLATTLDDWRYCLTQLIEDNDLRYQLASNAQTRIQVEWILSRNADRWAEAYQDIQTRTSGEISDDRLTKLFGSVNQQLFEFHKHKEEVVKDLNHQVQQKEHELRVAEFQVGESRAIASLLKTQVEELNREVVDYAMSKSWRWTRPLRKIAKRIRKLIGASDV